MTFDENPQVLIATAENIGNTLNHVLASLETIGVLCDQSRQIMQDAPSQDLFASLKILTDELSALAPGYRRYIEKLQARGEAGLRYLNGGY